MSFSNSHVGSLLTATVTKFGKTSALLNLGSDLYFEGELVFLIKKESFVHVAVVGSLCNFGLVCYHVNVVLLMNVRSKSSHSLQS